MIAGEGSTTNANSQTENAEIDKSADINAVVKVNDTDNGFITYIVKDEKTLKEIINSGITKLVIDGGEVLGTAYGSSVPATNYTASNVKWIEVKGQGGSLGTEIVVTNGVPSHFTSLFPSVIEITTSADATIADATFSAASIDFNIEAATTNIRGTVDAANADVVIGSYDSRNYEGVDATLNIPATTGVLNVNTITKTTDHPSEVTATIINQGTIKLPVNGSVDAGIKVEGNGATPGTDTSKEPAGDSGNATNYTLNLNTLANDLETKDWTGVTSVTINSTIAPNADQFKALKEALNGRDLILSGTNTTVNLGAGDGSLAANSLIVNGTATIGDTHANSKKVMLTVNEIEVATGATLTVNESWILVNQNVREGSGLHMNVTGTITYSTTYAGGSIVAIDGANVNGAYLHWDTTEKEWSSK